MQKENILTIRLQQKLRPIIKWTGGKYDEFNMFAKYIPDFKNYYEPFFGGGGVFFALQPKNISFINDKSTDLISFYQSIGSNQLKQQLFLYADAWEESGKLALFLTDKLINSFKDFVLNKVTGDEINGLIETSVKKIHAKKFPPLFDDEFILSHTAFKKALADSLIDKFGRIKRICEKEKRVFNHDELEDHIETGVKSGLYLYLRGLMNKASAGNLKLSKAKAIANWYFVREFCYASMFRYNSKGEFNIPYGGIAYNKKNFRQKVENIFSPGIQGSFHRTKIFNLDFQQFLETTKPQADDFIFIDPPYDSDFSEYDQNAFTQNDQLRLKDFLIKSRSKWMLVIKGTKFIRDLYKHTNCHTIEFKKTYTYNVRGRNNRDTQHLIIINYEY